MRERGTADRGGVSACAPLISNRIKLLPSLSEIDPCESGHCLCIEDGIRSRRQGLILVTYRCCRCDEVCA
jgi:hypothetical protein